MTRKAVLLALSFLLASCATHSSPGPIKEPAPVAVDPRVCVKIEDEPKLPDDAGIPQAVTEAEQAALEAFLLWVQRALDWGRVNATQAQTAKAALCHNG